jgi:L-ascorbate oxidase
VLALPLEVNNWLEYTLEPLNRSSSTCPSAEEVTRRLIFTAEEKIDPTTGQLIWQLAHMSWSETTRDKPVLVDIYERGQAAMPDHDAALANEGWDPATGLFPARKDEVLEIVIQNTGSQFEGASGIVETHPFHAHGQHYYDLGSGPGLFDAEEHRALLESLGGYTGIKRDTTMLYRYGEGKVEPGAPAGWRVWRMRMEHPGVWMVHCHVLAHMIMGELADFREKSVACLLTSVSQAWNPSLSLATPRTLPRSRCPRAKTTSRTVAVSLGMPRTRQRSITISMGRTSALLLGQRKARPKAIDAEQPGKARLPPPQR